MSDQEESVLKPFEYVVPLSGSSPRVTMDTDSPGFYSNNRTFQIHNRRSSNQTDTTPRFQNTSRIHEEDEEDEESEEMVSPTPSARHPIPPLPPLYSVEYGRSQSTLESWERGGGGGDSFSQASQSTGTRASYSQAYSQANLTPTSNRASLDLGSLPRGTSALQISFDGSVKEVPIHVPVKQASGTFSSSTNSQANSYVSRSKNSSQDKSSYLRNSVGTMISGDSNHSTSIQDRDEEGNYGASSDGFDDDEVEPVVIWNIILPPWLSKIVRERPSLTQMSNFIVHVAPCFWCSSNNIRGSSTDRAVLTRLTILALFFTSVQLFAGLWLACLLLFLDDEPGALRGFAPHLWNLNGAAFAVGILGFVLIITCFCTIRVIKVVDLVGAIRYLWVLLWLFPFELFFNISLFDYHQVTGVWIRHWYVASVSV
jgi:hypothetical protein